MRQNCAPSSLGSSGYAAFTDAHTVDRPGWTVANQTGADAPTFSSDGMTVVPHAGTGWFNNGNLLVRDNGYYRFVEIPGDFRVRGRVEVASSAPDAGMPPGAFSNAGLLVQVPSRCLVGGQVNIWFLLDHGFQGLVVDHLFPDAGIQDMPYFGVLWKQNQSSPDGGITQRQPFAEPSSAVEFLMCRRGTRVEGCFRASSTWTCGVPVEEPALAAIPALNVGFTAGDFTGGAPPIAGTFSAFAVDGAPDAGEPCQFMLP